MMKKRTLLLRKLHLRKKAESGAEEWIEQIPYIALTAIVIIAIFLLVNYYVNLSINVRDLEFEVVIARILYSPNSIMQTDPISGIVNPGVVEWSNFTDQVLDNSIRYSSERHVSAKLELYDADKKLLKTAYLNRVWYERLEPLAYSNMAGAGSAQIYPKILPIVFRINDVNQPGYLRIQVIIPKT
ncbi:hypothetical protein JXB28_05275 [Candidatus Woesearchaeota archaeon]|nr:hypothetical protein [Candidatus Woesearchaeota archaeon]